MNKYYPGPPRIVWPEPAHGTDPFPGDFADPGPGWDAGTFLIPSTVGDDAGGF